MATERHAAKGKARASNPENSASARVRKPRPNGSTAGYAQSTKMTPLLEQFALEIVKDFNGAAAWRRANAALGRKIPKNAAASACQALKHPMVQQRATNARAIALAKAGISVEKTETEIARLAYVDIGDAFDGQMMLKPLHLMSEETRRCIAAVEVEELYERAGPDADKLLDEILPMLRDLTGASTPEAIAGIIAAIKGWLKDMPDEDSRERVLIGHLRKVKFWDKPKNLEMAARRDGLFKDKVVHEAGASLEKIIAQSYQVETP